MNSHGFRRGFFGVSIVSLMEEPIPPPAVDCRKLSASGFLEFPQC
jgi:hypothetical protein